MMPRPLSLAAGLLVLAGAAGAQPPAPLPPSNAPTTTPQPALPVQRAGQYMPPGGVQKSRPTAPGVETPQQPATAPGVGQPVPPGTTPGTRPLFPGHQPAPAAVAPTAPADSTVEQLLAELERLQGEKAQLLKREGDLKAVIRTNIAEIQKRMEKLDAVPGAAKAAQPDMVGSILVTGFSKKDEKQVHALLETVGVRPGQLLRHKAIDDVRLRLMIAGHPNAKVEVVPPGLDSRVHGLHEVTRLGLDPRYKEIRVTAYEDRW